MQITSYKRESRHLGRQLHCPSLFCTREAKLGFGVVCVLFPSPSYGLLPFLEAEVLGGRDLAGTGFPGGTDWRGWHTQACLRVCWSCLLASQQLIRFYDDGYF